MEGVQIMPLAQIMVSHLVQERVRSKMGEESVVKEAKLDFLTAWLQEEEVFLVMATLLPTMKLVDLLSSTEAWVDTHTMTEVNSEVMGDLVVVVAETTIIYVEEVGAVVLVVVKEVLGMESEVAVVVAPTTQAPIRTIQLEQILGMERLLSLFYLKRVQMHPQ